MKSVFTRMILVALAMRAAAPALQSQSNEEATAGVLPVSQEDIMTKTRSVTDPKDIWKYQHENMVTGFMGVMNRFGVRRTDMMLYRSDMLAEKIRRTLR